MQIAINELLRTWLAPPGLVDHHYQFAQRSMVLLSAVKRFESEWNEIGRGL
jgi:hypothetical protein